jgi:hypothetical protein
MPEAATTAAAPPADPAKPAPEATPADVIAAADKAAARVAAKSDLPAKIRLMAPHGFVDDDGRNRFWLAGTVVCDPAEIALLVERRAPMTAVVD